MERDFPQPLGETSQPPTAIADEAERLKALSSDALMEHLLGMEQRLADGAGRSGPARAQQPMSARVARLEREIIKVNERAASMRLDRQVRLAFRRIGIKLGLIKPRLSQADIDDAARAERRRAKAAEIAAMMTIESDVVIICGAYPGGARQYGGQFIKSRMDLYRRAGLHPVVVEVSNQTKAVSREPVDGVDVLRVNAAGLAKVMRLSTVKVIGVHSIEQPVWEVIRPLADTHPVVVWVHGFEARPWEALAFNFSDSELDTLRPRLDAANAQRRQTMAEVMAHPNVSTVFVSQFMRNVAEDFAGQQAANPHVIANPVDPEVFPYRPKTAEQRKSILWLRSFSAANYSSDISRDVILGLSRRPWFADLSITVMGDGKLFDDMTAPLRGFDNVTIRRGVFDRPTMEAAFAAHGVKLVPTRWDSHGLTMSEAMHAGLVPLATYTAGPREYVDEKSGVLAELGDAQALIDGYAELYDNPDRFLAMSAAAHQKAAALCGPAATTDREVALIRSLLPPG